MCVFPKRCEQPVLCAGSLLANVLNWPWETVHPQMLGSYIHNGSFTCFSLYVCFHTHAGLPWRERAHTCSERCCVGLHVSAADDSVPGRQLLYVLILIRAWAAAHHIPAPWCKVSEGGHYHPVRAVSKRGEREDGHMDEVRQSG